MTDFSRLLQMLVDERVEFVIIGGLAVISHGHIRATLDLDLCYARTPENLGRLVLSEPSLCKHSRWFGDRLRTNSASACKNGAPRDLSSCPRFLGS